MAEASHLLVVDGVSKSFGQNSVLRSASLRVGGGEFIALLGRNGSGKTTLLRVAAGDLTAELGSITFLGRRRERHRLASAAREGLMYLPQMRLLSPSFSIRDHFSMIGSRFGALEFDTALERMRARDLLDANPSELSGGERARLSFALAWARQPRVLLADEPLASLSPLDQDLVASCLQDLARSGAAVVASGHDSEQLLKRSDRVLWSVAGTTHELGTPREALENEEFRVQYLGNGSRGTF